tara:strand:+ start:455 stop:688 length:234 start_codon:yes stop_codon:yes gene_type:complete
MRIENTWSKEDIDKLFFHDWAIKDFVSSGAVAELVGQDTISDDWNVDSLIEAINKDMEEELGYMEILKKYLKEVDDI